MKGALVLLMCVVTRFLEFFSRIGDEIHQQFAKAWQMVKILAKRPVRVKRINENIVNDKNMTHPTRNEAPGDIASVIERTTAKTTSPKRTKKSLRSKKGRKIPSYFDRYQDTKEVILPFDRNIRNQETNKVILPIIAAPEWRTMKDWYEVQRPRWRYIPKRFRGTNGPNATEDLSEVVTEDYNINSTRTEPPKNIPSETKRTTTNPKRTTPVFSYFDRNNKRDKIILPIIAVPVWTTMKDWYEEQQPRWRYVPKRDGFFRRDAKEGDWSDVVTEDSGDENAATIELRAG